jgi:hypothetical protein
MMCLIFEKLQKQEKFVRRILIHWINVKFFALIKTNKKGNYCLSYFVTSIQARPKKIPRKICENGSFYFHHFWCSASLPGTQFEQKGNPRVNLTNHKCKYIKLQV